MHGAHPLPPPADTRVTLDPNSLASFVDPLPILKIAQSSGTRPSPGDSKVEIPYYRVEMRELESHVHRDLKATRVWGFGASSPGPILEARSGEPMLVEWVSALPQRHFLPVDHNLHGAEAGLPEVRSVVHLHGGRVPPQSDGYPEDWFVPGKSAFAHYPNQQEAATLWYHDHAMGINRLNSYAGLLGVYIVRNNFEEALNLPRDKYEIPLVIFDRMFDKDGQLYYPEAPVPNAPWMPEVFGNAHLVNGKLLPFLDVEPRKYRFRVLNGANGRFYHLSLGNGVFFQQIGTDQGLLPAPVPVKQLTLGPAERADVVIDFATHGGEQIILKNDVFTSIMQFRVAKSGGKDSAALPQALRPVDRIPESAAVKTRQLSIDEYRDLTGNTTLMLLNKSYWHMPVTEKPVLNTTEIWTIVNPTDDSHPIHLHLVRFQILDRRRFEPFAFQTAGELKYTGPVTPPEPGEMGWKDTVRAEPKMVTRIIARFEGYTGRYVWHCHILEHEDNEMMRPYEIVAS